MAATSHPMSLSRILGCSNPIDDCVSMEADQLRSYNSRSPPAEGIKSNFITRGTNESMIGQDQVEQAIIAGYTSDDESSDSEELHDSGRTRSSARRANPAKEKQNEPAPTRTTRSSEKDPSSDGGSGKGRKRKKVGPGGGGSDSEPEEGQDKRRPCVEPIVEESEQVVCLCPKDVMTCIGILPSHPIISRFQDSDDSDSSCNDDLSHIVLPTVTRHRREGRGGGGEGC